MIRKALILSFFLVLLAAETVYFGRGCVAGLLRLGAERAFYRNDHRAAWTLYHRAMAWGGNPGILETDLVELIGFGLDQFEGGIKIDLPLPPEESIPLAHELIARRLRETPYKAYCWSLASDVSLHEARQRRRATVLDLTSLSEDPMVNLLPEERNAIAALEIAARLEPMNYLYHDLLRDAYIELGVEPKASESCRRAVRSFPYLDNHRYLWRSDLPHDMLESAVGGFEDALSDNSLVPREVILLEAGRLLAWHGQDARAEPFLSRVLEVNPRHYDALMEIAMIRLRRKDDGRALEALQRASLVNPEDPWPDYYAGIAHMDLGQTDLAVVAFQSSREKGSGEMMFFHALGRALEARGLLKEAERQYAAAANLHPEKAEGWAALLDFHLRHRNIRAAEEACSRLSRLNGGKGVSNDACNSLGQDLR